MDLDFETPTTPNFVNTKQGRFAITDLTEYELGRFIARWTVALLNSYQVKMNAKKREEAKKG